MGVQIIEVTLAANGRQELPYPGTFFRCTEASAQFQISPDGAGNLDVEKGIQVRTNEPFKKLYIVNGATAQTVKIYVGSGSVDDSRFSLLNPIGDTRTLSKVTTAATTAALLLAANGNRVSATIQTDVEIWLGPDATVTDSTGIKLGAGGTLEDKNTGALWVYSLAIAAVVTLEDSK